MQIFIHCKTTPHVSGVTAPIIRGIKNCNRSLRYRSYSKMPGLATCTATPLLRGLVWTSPVPEAAGTVFYTPDDGCCGTRNM